MECQRICLIHYHEIGLKGKNRALFERQLIRNLKHGLARFDIASVDRISGHIRICTHTHDASLELLQAAACIPGVARASLAFKVPQDITALSEAACEVLAHAPSFSSFKVHAHKASSQFEMHTLDINREIGDALCRNFPDKRVQMHKPDVTVEVHIVNDAAYVYAKLLDSALSSGFGAIDTKTLDPASAVSIVGVGGLPVGTAGKVVTLLSSGFDSPVASWMVARRGANIVPIHFSGRPMTSNASEYLTKEIVQALAPYGMIGRLYVCPFGEKQRAISLAVPQSLRIICYRRVMFAVAERICALEGAKAIVTGESLGQVASQTLENISVVNEMVKLPVLRPLIGSDKQEIIARAQMIGTYDISSQTAPDCCTLFMPKSPETHARAQEIHKAWDMFDHDAMIEDLVAHIEYIDYDQCPSYRRPKEKSEFHSELGV